MATKNYGYYGKKPKKTGLSKNNGLIQINVKCDLTIQFSTKTDPIVRHMDETPA